MTFQCECVSIRENQAVVSAFRSRTEKLGLNYYIDADLRPDAKDARLSGELAAGHTERNSGKYTVRYTENGTEKEKSYASRENILLGSEYAECSDGKYIASRGYLCTHSSNYIVIYADTAVGRTKNNADCRHKMRISDYSPADPMPCGYDACTLCGGFSLYAPPYKK